MTSTTPNRSKWRKFFIGAAWVVSLIALYYGWTDWRGRTAWAAYRSDFERQVASLDLKNYVPKEIPASNNFALNPVSATWMERIDTNKLFYHDHFHDADLHLVGWTKTNERHYLDLVAYARALDLVKTNTSRLETPKIYTEDRDISARSNAAPAVLSGMADDQAAFNILREAANLTESRYPLFYDLKNPWGILLPHLYNVKQACRRLQLRCSAELALGDANSALDDLHLMFVIENSTRTEPFIISLLVRYASFRLASDVIWEGISEHAWTHAQLKQIQQWIDPIHYPAEAVYAGHSEYAAAIRFAEQVKEDPTVLADAFNGGMLSESDPVPSRETIHLLGWMVPSGWIDLEKINLMNEYERQSGHQLDHEPLTRIDKDKIVVSGPENKDSVWGAVRHHRLLADLFLPSLKKYLNKVAEASVCREMTLIACAIERYRLAHAQLPDRLEPLVPTYLQEVPNDILTGQPMAYDKTGTNQYDLHSEGWEVSQTKTSLDLPALNVGVRWKWHYPAND